MRTEPGRACVAAAKAGARVIAQAHRARGRQGFGVAFKGRINLVTEVDERAEAAVVERLRQLFPGVAILAEEGGTMPGRSSNRRFIVDPLDGTTNFAHGFPVFCISVAYEEAGEVVAGAVVDPTREELCSRPRWGPGPSSTVARFRCRGPAIWNRRFLRRGFLIPGLQWIGR